jgi:hypothetical protein
MDPAQINKELRVELTKQKSIVCDYVYCRKMFSEEKWFWCAGRWGNAAEGLQVVGGQS